MNSICNRTEELKKRLNGFLNEITNTEHDYFNELSQEKLIHLKNAISDINNVFTLKMTEAFLKWIKINYNIDENVYNNTLDSINRISPNTNGFDIVIEEYKILVEIKAIIPINNGNYYGAAQRDSILKDAINLKEGKRDLENTSEYYKFIGLIDTGENTKIAIKKLLKPYSEGNIRTKNQIRLKMHDIVKELEWIKEKEDLADLSKCKIYIKELRIDEKNYR